MNREKNLWLVRGMCPDSSVAEHQRVKLEIWVQIPVQAQIFLLKNINITTSLKVIMDLSMQYNNVGKICQFIGKIFNLVQGNGMHGDHKECKLVHFET